MRYTCREWSRLETKIKQLHKPRECLSAQVFTLNNSDCQISQAPDGKLVYDKYWSAHIQIPS